MCLSLFEKGGGGLKQAWGPPLEKGREQEKAVSHPARSLTPTPTVPRRLDRNGGRSFVSGFGDQEEQKQPGPGEDVSPKPLLYPLPENTMNHMGNPLHRVREERRRPFIIPARFPAPSSPLARTATRARGRDLVSVSPRTAAAPGRSLPRPAPTLRELQLQLRQLRPHFGRQRRHRGRRGLQASLRHPGSASHTPEDKRGGRRRDGLTRVHTPATGSGSGLREPPAPLLPPPP